MSDTTFIECEACRAKPGMPVLCAGCLRRRSIWDKFEQANRDKPLADAIAATCQGDLPETDAQKGWREAVEINNKLAAELLAIKVSKDSTVDYYRYMIEYALNAPNWAAGLSILHDALAGIKGAEDKPLDQQTDFDKYIEQVSYTETVDAMLDGTIPTRVNGNKIYLKERVKLLLEQLEQTADKLSDCWLLMDAFARQSVTVEELRAQAKDYLKRQGCPGW